MLTYEMKKMWHQPIVLLVLVGVIIFHILSITSSSYVSYWTNLASTMTAYEGVMDSEWKAGIQEAYNSFMANDQNFYDNEELKQKGYSEEDIKKMNLHSIFNLRDEIANSPSYLVLSMAYEDSFFQEKLENLIQYTKKKLLQTYPNIHLTQITEAFSGLVDEKTHIFTNSSSFSLVQMEMTKMIRTCVLVLVVLLSTIFSREQDNQTLELMITCKRIRKVKWVKLVAALLSAVLSWMLILGVIFVSVALIMGFHGENGIVQDFIFNVCPYPLNQGMYTICMCLLSLVGVICVSMLICGISSLVMKNQIAMMICLMLFLVLPFFNRSMISDLLYYHPSNFIGANYLLASYQVTKLGDYYINNLYIIPVILFACFICVLLLLHIRCNQKYVMLSKNQEE